jgi:hypothetical protein
MKMDRVGLEPTTSAAADFLRLHANKQTIPAFFLLFCFFFSHIDIGWMASQTSLHQTSSYLIYPKHCEMASIQLLPLKVQS